MALDRDAAEEAVGALAKKLDLSTGDAAAGIARVAGTEMARAVRVMTVERGASFSQGFTNTLEVDPQTGRVPELDRYQYVVRLGADTRFGLRGSNTVAAFGGLVVLTAERPYRADW